MERWRGEEERRTTKRKENGKTEARRTARSRRAWTDEGRNRDEKDHPGPVPLTTYPSHSQQDNIRQQKDNMCEDSSTSFLSLNQPNQPNQSRFTSIKTVDRHRLWKDLIHQISFGFTEEKDETAAQTQNKR